MTTQKCLWDATEIVSDSSSKSTSYLALRGILNFMCFICRCVVEQDPDKTWYMSRAFQQTSLSASGLFIADSGLMTAVKFTTEEKIFFKCTINFCFFIDTAPDKCTDVSEIVKGL